MNGRLAVWMISLVFAEGYAFDVAKFLAGFWLFGEFEECFFAFASYDYVHGFFVGEDFFVAVGCVWTAHDDGGFWADFFGDLGRL